MEAVLLAKRDTQPAAGFTNDSSTLEHEPSPYVEDGTLEVDTEVSKTLNTRRLAVAATDPSMSFGGLLRQAPAPHKGFGSSGRHEPLNPGGISIGGFVHVALPDSTRRSTLGGYLKPR